MRATLLPLVVMEQALVEQALVEQALVEQALVEQALVEQALVEHYQALPPDKMGAKWRTILAERL
jgi:hypothetical protein